MRASFRANEWVRLDRGPVVRVDHQKPSLAQNPILLSHRCTHRPQLLKQLARTGLRPIKSDPAVNTPAASQSRPHPRPCPALSWQTGGRPTRSWLITNLEAPPLQSHHHPRLGLRFALSCHPGVQCHSGPPASSLAGLQRVFALSLPCFVGYDMHAGTLQSRPTRRESTKTITVSRTTSHHFSDSRPDITHPLISLETDQCCDPARTFNRVRAACPALYIAPASRRTAGTELNTS